VLSAADLPANETGRLKDADVTRYAGEGHGQWPGEVGDAGVAVPQSHQQRPTSRVGQSGEGPIENLIFNHLV
jgi:hypothetical protein